MVFSVWVKFDGSGRRKGTGREGMGIVAGYSWNRGNSLFFRVMDSIYRFYIGLFAPNYVVMAPLPGATIESDFKLKLKLRLARRSTDLVNEGYGYITISYYSISLGQRDTSWFIYEVEILEGDARLDHTNFITKFPMPAPVSVLL
jgi:hypothetical protein